MREAEAGTLGNGAHLIKVDAQDAKAFGVAAANAGLSFTPLAVKRNLDLTSPVRV